MIDAVLHSDSDSDLDLDLDLEERERHDRRNERAWTWKTWNLKVERNCSGFAVFGKTDQTL